MRAAEADRLRQALLTSISHDLRTPLAAIIGSAGDAARLRRRPDRGERAPNSLGTILDESERLEPLHRQPPRHDPARIRRRSRRTARPHDLGEIVGSALQRAGQGAGRPPRRGRACRPTCRWSTSTRCSSSRCCSTCSTTPRNTRPRAPPSASTAGARAAPAARVLQIARRGRGHPARRPRARLRQVPPRAEGRPGARRHRPRPRDLPRLRRGHGRHDRRRPTAPDGPGAVFTVTLPAAGTPRRDGTPHERARRSASSSSTTSRRSAGCCAPASPRRATTSSRPANGREARARSRRAAPDLVILDLGLPDVSGPRAPARWRAAGSDDAGRHPLQPHRRGRHRRGAGARRRRLCHQAVRHEGARRPHPHRAAPPPAGARRAARCSRSGDLTVDLVRRIVRLGGAEVKLTPREYEVLRVLVQHAGKVLTHQFSDPPGLGRQRRRAEPARPVRQLRQKIEADPERPRHILHRDRRRLPAHGSGLRPHPFGYVVKLVELRSSGKASMRSGRSGSSAPNSVRKSTR